MSNRVRVVFGCASELVPGIDHLGDHWRKWEEQGEIALNLDHVVSFTKTDSDETRFETVNNRSIVIDVPYSKVLAWANGY